MNEALKKPRKAKKDLKNEILKNYFTLNGNIATLKLVYNTFSELINPNFGDGAIEKLNDTLFSDIREAVRLLPRRFRLDLHIAIKDFGDYQREECEKIIRQNVHLLAYRTFQENRRKLFSGFSLIGAGAVILVLSYLLHKYELWFDLINISGTLFVWEGVNMAFLERNLEHKATIRLARAIQNITIEQEKEITTCAQP